jgi:hypothetical protein
MNKNTSQGQIHCTLHPFLFLATRCLSWYDCQRSLLDESGVLSCKHHSTTVLQAQILPGARRRGQLVGTFHRHILTSWT